MANAKFTIDGTPWADRGFVATGGQTISLQLEDQPSVDVYRCRFYVNRKTEGAPSPVFAPSDGEAVPANGIVSLTIPSGVHTYEIVCEVNNGVNEDGRNVTEYVSSRFVAVLTGNGLRKILPFETTEFDQAFRWEGAVNDIVDQAGAGGSGTVTNVSGTAPIQVANGTTTPVVSISAATTLAAGSMSAADKTKLDTVSSGARVASVSGSSPITIGGTPETPIVQIPAATTVSPGYMSETDKQKLNALTPWTQTALITSNHNAVAWEHVLVDFGGASGDITITLPASSLATKNARVKISEVSADGGVGSGNALLLAGTIATTSAGAYLEPPYVVANNGFGASKVGAWIELLDTGAGWLPVAIGCVP